MALRVARIPVKAIPVAFAILLPALVQATASGQKKNDRDQQPGKFTSSFHHTTSFHAFYYVAPRIRAEKITFCRIEVSPEPGKESRANPECT
jgi:hypothetical protein